MIGSLIRTAQRIFVWLQVQSWKYAGYYLEWKTLIIVGLYKSSSKPKGKGILAAIWIGTMPLFDFRMVHICWLTNVRQRTK